MADRTLLNKGMMSGSYGAFEFENEASSEVSVYLPNVPFIKSADKETWIGGDLTYTLTIDNSEGSEALTDLVVTDELDTTKFLYIADSVVVKIDDIPIDIGDDYQVSYSAGTLTVELLVEVPVASVLTITFRGSKVS